MARPQKQGLSEARHALRWQAPSRFEIKVALVIGFLALALTVLRSVGGMDPDTAAAHGVALALGAFAGLLAVYALAAINFSASRWYLRRTVEPWLERGERRYEAVIAALKAAGIDVEAGAGKRRRTPSRLSWWSRDRFYRVVEVLTYVAWGAFALVVGWSVDRVLLAAGGMEPAGVSPIVVAVLGVSGVLSLASYQIPLAVGTLKLYMLDRALGEIERLLANGEHGAANRSRTPPPRSPALVEPVLKRLGPIPMPGWRHPQPDAP